MSLRVLSIGSERNLFKSSSEAQKRIKEYGQLFDELKIIVFQKADANQMRMMRIANNVFVYPTNHQFQFLYLWYIYKIVRSWNGWKPDVITCQDPMAVGLAGWLLKIYFSVPLQLQIHADIFSPYFWQESFKNKVGVILAKFLLPRANGIRVVSQRIKDSLESNVKCQLSNAVVLPIFVDVKKIQSAKIKTNLREKYPEYDFIILMASRLTKEKNIGIAIEVMAEVKRQATSDKRQILLLIVGDGPERNALQLTIDKLQLTNDVVIENWSNDLISYYKTADLFLLTSNHESYARTVVEAMAAGTPVIMTDVGVARELLIDDLDGRVIPIGDKKALTEAILELMENPAKREEFKQNCLKLLGKWPTKQEYLEKYKSSLMMLK